MNNNHEKLKSDVCYVCGKVCHAEYLIKDNLLCEECGRVADKLNGQMERFEIKDYGIYEICHQQATRDDDLLKIGDSYVHMDCKYRIEEEENDEDSTAIKPDNGICKLCECLLKEDEVYFCEDCRFMLTEGFKVNEGIFR